MSALARARLNVELLFATLLDRVPPMALGTLVESIARDEATNLPGRIECRSWHHEGLVAFVRTLAVRLLDVPALAAQLPEPPGAVDVTAAHKLSRVAWSLVPHAVSSELLYRLAQHCRTSPGKCYCGCHNGTEVCS